MASPHVWWTIPGSTVAWEWHPGDAVVQTGRLTGEGGALRFRATERWVPMWTSAPTRAAFQAFKDLTALFAEECNIVPGDMRIFWIAQERAVSWHRPTGALSRHEVKPPEDGLSPVVLAGEEAAGDRVGDVGEAADLRTADTLARVALQG